MKSFHKEIEVDREYYNYMRDRNTHAEVVLLLPRPERTLLTLRKRFYPTGLYNLPSGKMEVGESYEQTFVREAAEETSLDVECTALVAQVTHLLICGEERLSFVSYIAQGSESVRAPYPKDEAEQISEFKAASATDLREMASSMRSLGGRWLGFGRFRATALWIAACYLSDSWNNLKR